MTYQIYGLDVKHFTMSSKDQCFCMSNGNVLFMLCRKPKLSFP